MQKLGYCVTCDKTFPLETRVAGKLIALGSTALLGASNKKLPVWAKLIIGVGSVALAHKIDEEMALHCPTEGCKTLLKVVDSALS